MSRNFSPTHPGETRGREHLKAASALVFDPARSGWPQQEPRTPPKQARIVDSAYRDGRKLGASLRGVLCEGQRYTTRSVTVSGSE